MRKENDYEEESKEVSDSVNILRKISDVLI